jgi:hypothetical protein
MLGAPLALLILHILAMHTPELPCRQILPSYETRHHLAERVALMIRVQCCWIGPHGQIGVLTEFKHSVEE